MLKLSVIFSILILIFKLLCLVECDQKIEKNFLNFVDATHLLHIKPSKYENRSGPSYLMNAYSETIDKIEINYVNYQLTPEDLAKIRKSDTVASFVAQQPHKGRGGKPNKVQRMWFDTLIINKEQQVLRADLRLFRDDTEIIDSYRDHEFNLTVYRVEGKNKNKKFVYVDSVVIEPKFKGWIVLDVTESFQWWTNDVESNNGFKITTTLMKNSTLIHPVKPESVGIVGFDGNEDKHAFAVGYYQGVGETFREFQVSTVVKHQRRPRAADIHDFDYEEEYYDVKTLNKLDQELYRYKKSVCKLRKILIRLADIGLGFIIAPAVIEVNDCIGKCQFPFSAQANATDHSILKIQQSIHGISRLNKPGCTPISFEDKMFLYFGSKNVLLSRKFPDVSASGCGCR